MDTQKTTTAKAEVNAKPMTVPQTMDEAMDWFVRFMKRVHDTKKFSILFTCNSDAISITVYLDIKPVISAQYSQYSCSEFRYEFEKMNMFLRDNT